MFGWRSQLGFITPSNNTVIEPELWHVVPDGVSFHFTKLTFRSTARDGKNKDVDSEALDALHRGGMDAIGYACMATSLVDSDKWEQNATERTGIPTATATGAVKEALRAAGAHTISMVCHYPEDRLGLVKESFENDGFKVVSIETASVDDSRAVNLISTETVYRLSRKVDSPDADALCLLATDLRTFPVLQQLEEDLGKPVIGTNQALLWKVLQLANVDCKISGYGSLLSGEFKPAAVAR